LLHASPFLVNANVESHLLLIAVLTWLFELLILQDLELSRVLRMGASVGTEGCHEAAREVLDAFLRTLLSGK
jgi:hypothetical protein